MAISIVAARAAAFALALTLTLVRASAAELSYRELKELVREKHITSTGQLMATLPEELRRRYALVYESRSLHAATPRCPRIILFSNDAKLVLAMEGIRPELGCGEPSGAHAASLEIIEYQPFSKTFDFHRIDFSAPSRPVFQENPARCAGCHRQSKRPNWDSYSVWQGVYGGIDDGISPNTVEGRNFADFIRSNAKRGLYQYLVSLSDLRLEPATGHLPKGERFHYVTTDASATHEVKTRLFDPPYRPEQPRMNLKFTKQIAQWNYERIARLVAREVPLMSERARVMAALLRCPDFEGYLPAADRMSYRREYLARVYKYTTKIHLGYAAKIEALSPHVGEYVRYGNQFDFGTGKDFAALDFVLRGRARREEWSMTLTPRAYAFHDGYPFVDLIAPLAEELFAGVPALSSLIKEGYNADEEKACAALKPLSREEQPLPKTRSASPRAVASISVSTPPTQASNQQAVWQRELKGTLSYTNAIARNGAIYYGSSQAFYALSSATGEEIWRNDSLSPLPHCHPVLEGDRVFVVTSAGALVALDSRTGSRLWTASAHDILTSPLVDAGRVIIQDGDGAIRALAADTGKILWSRSVTGSLPRGRAPAAGEGRIFVGTATGWVHALDAATGEEIWKVRTPAAIRSSVVYGQGVVALSMTKPPEGKPYGHFMALDPATGTARWDHTAYDHEGSSDPIINDGIVYFGENIGPGKIWAISLSRGEVVWSHDFMFPPVSMTLDQSRKQLFVTGGVVNPYRFAASVAALGTASGTVELETTPFSEVGNGIWMKPLIVDGTLITGVETVPGEIGKGSLRAIRLP